MHIHYRNESEDPLGFSEKIENTQECPNSDIDINASDVIDTDLFDINCVRRLKCY